MMFITFLLRSDEAHFYNKPLGNHSPYGKARMSLVLKLQAQLRK